jgi:TusA-related sulfurtransferase
MNRLAHRLMLIFLASALPAAAIDINPSKQTVPDRFINPPGKRFSIFAGDPERVQKVNEVQIKDFTAKLEIVRKEISLEEIRLSSDEKPALDALFTVQNIGKRSYTLSFPDAQRYDFMVQNAAGEAVYVWSDDKIFVQEIGKSFVNAGERLSFRPYPHLNLSGVLKKLQPGEYKLTAILCNYTELKAEAPFTIIR